MSGAGDCHDRLRADMADLHPDNGSAGLQGEDSSAAVHEYDGRVRGGPNGPGQVGRRGAAPVVQPAASREAPCLTNGQLELIRADPRRRDLRDQAGVRDHLQLLLAGLADIQPDISQ